jgi:uncharacterized membrane protein
MLLPRVIFSIVLAIVFSAGLFFFPRWQRFWVTSRANSVYGVLSEQYGRRTMIWIMVIATLVIAVIIFYTLQSMSKS